jgi:hypothetical protein
MVFNIGGNLTSVYSLSVFTSIGATVTAQKKSKKVSVLADTSGTAFFEKLTKGIWEVTVTLGTLISQMTVELLDDTAVSIPVNSIPDFTYSGSYAVYDGAGNNITSNPRTQGNWKIKFLTNGEFKISRMNGLAGGIDVFAVGGGARGMSKTGGGGGYTKTVRNVTIKENTPYSIVIGAGGGDTGGTSSGFGVSAAGGSGANGGSGGGSLCAAGGSNGSNGGVYGSDYANGKGQGSTTREFGESGGALYAGGGGGGAVHTEVSYMYAGSGGSGGGGSGAALSSSSAANGAANTGGGGGGASFNGDYYGGDGNYGYGGSGIVVIRNAR